MSRSFLLSFLFLACGLDPNTVIGKGKITTETREVGAFSKLKIESAIEVTATEGTRAVTVSTDSNALGLVETLVKGDTLVVRLRDFASVMSSRPVRVTVANDQLTAIDVSGASLLDATGLFRASANAQASGASTVKLHGLATTDLTLKATGASTVILDGTSPTLNATLEGASTLQARDLASDRVQVDVGGASKATVRARVSVTGTASGASTVIVTGAPAVVSVERSGASSTTVE